MLIAVVLFNTFLALVLLYVAWQLQRLRRSLGQIAEQLMAYERSAQVALRGIPDAIYLGQQGIHRLRQQKQPPDVRLQRVRQVLTLLGLGQQVWQRFMVVRKTQFVQRGLAKYR